jgi:hypothetical protein
MLDSCRHAGWQSKHFVIYISLHFLPLHSSISKANRGVINALVYLKFWIILKIALCGYYLVA